MTEAIKALREASISIATLLDEHCDDPLKKDLEHIQKQITILENFLDPFTIAEIEEINSVADSVDSSENDLWLTYKMI